MTCCAAAPAETGSVSSSRRRGREARAAVASLALLTLLALAPAPAGAAARAPAGFFGVTPQAALTAGDLGRMARLGMTLRVPAYWFQLEPERGTYDFSALDPTVRAAARAGVRVLPFVYGSPAWAASAPSEPPVAGGRAKAWAAFLRELVARYGPRGSFWKGAAARQPIRRWQIWNEPNFRVFWSPRPSPVAYVRLLRRSAGAIRRQDPGAEIVAAGLAPVEGGLYPWTFLRRMYRHAGAERSFDVAALHPYATSLGALEYELRATRRVMAAAGDGRTRLLVTEVGVASDGRYPNPFDMGRRGQARFLEDAYRLMLENRRRWRLAGAYWFTWRDGTSPDPNCVFCEYAGLLDSKGTPKPAWWALKRTVAQATVR
ncbi:MAG TPA: hypothetical protein VFY69_08115 [Solirubrobacterales bacterium]|nr:hypothetical protein [Solirubrobacterales bacterium]